MTGLWQIAGRSDLSFDDLVRLDFYYLENWSLWLDITILVKTLPAVIARRGASDWVRHPMSPALGRRSCSPRADRQGRRSALLTYRARAPTESRS